MGPSGGAPPRCAGSVLAECSRRRWGRVRPLLLEGLAFNHGEWSGHGWVVRKSDGQVVECTDGYETSSAYRGICLEVAEVEEFIDGRPLVKGRSCRERWRTTYPDGSTRSEAPGVITILAEEVIEQGSDMFEWHRELSRWLDRGMANGRSLPGRD